MSKKNETTMENSKKIQTENENKAKYLSITDALETFNILLEIGIERGMNIPDLSDKTGINKQALYRYSSDFNSQKKAQPSVSTITKLAEALGFEIRLIKKEEENVNKK